MNIKIIILLFFISYSINSQSPILQKDVKSLLTSKNTETIDLYGYFDDKYEVQLYLIHDDVEWEGVCYYPSSKTKIKLEGGAIKDNIILNEIDNGGTIVGRWIIEIKKHNKPAKWMNISGSKKYNLNLTLLNKSNKSLDFRFASVDSYLGNIINNDYSLTVFNVSNSIHKANLVDLKNGIHLVNTVKCTSPSCNEFEIIMSGNKKIKKLECKVNEEGKLDIDIYNQFVTKFTTTLKRVNTYELKHISYIDKYFQYYINYPKVSNQNINTLFEKQMEKLAESITNELKKELSSMEDLDNRLSLSAITWFDIDMISNDIISGTIITQKTYKSEIPSKPVLISLKKGDKINIYDEFKSDFNSEFYIEQFLKDKINKLYKDNSTSKWYRLRPNDFKNITLNQAGIVFSTKFNSIIGTKKIILPYQEIKDKIKRKSILNKIMLK